ncbi:hypothetical protein M434DRAFT_17040 [Hypoxylon sp. CO27-5]|nr:hypothetical protein M434DRAFT_17040 [Hypoxylon sp. CO27-5]
MLAKQQYMYAALVGFGSLAQAAVQFPTCITSCVRQNGCAPTNTDCMCEKASGNFLSDVVICMNQWCSSDTKFSDLIGPIQSNCKVPQDAIDAAVSKAGFDTSGSSSGSDSDSSSAGSSSKASSTEQVVSATMGVGAPNKIDGSTSAPEATGTATKDAGSLSSVVLTDSTAVITATPTASGSLLVATTLSSVPSATGTSSASTSSDSSTSDESSGSTDGSPAGSSTGGENAATTSQASLLAAVMAVAAAMAFGW